MLSQFIGGINISKLIEMQANQQSFAPGVNSIGKALRIENKRNVAKSKQSVQRKCKVLVKTYGKSKFYKDGFEK